MSSTSSGSCAAASTRTLRSMIRCDGVVTTFMAEVGARRRPPRTVAYRWCDMCGVLWYGVVWWGGVGWAVVWCGVVWCGVVWCGVVWCGVVWCGVVWCGVVWCCVVWCGVVWCGVVWCGVVWCTQGAVTKWQRPGCPAYG